MTDLARGRTDRCVGCDFPLTWWDRLLLTQLCTNCRRRWRQDA